jgi:hypothetical protein
MQDMQKELHQNLLFTLLIKRMHFSYQFGQVFNRRYWKLLLFFSKQNSQFFKITLPVKVLMQIMDGKTSEIRSIFSELKFISKYLLYLFLRFQSLC